MRRRVLRARQPEVLDAGLHGRDVDGLHLGLVERVRVDLLDDRRHALLEQDLDRADERVAVEPLLETVALQHVRDGEQAHPLVVRHVRADERLRRVAVGRDAAGRVVDGLVVAHRPMAPASSSRWRFESARSGRTMSARSVEYGETT